ncbi:MAG: Hpt domain-containing protein [Alphaproteobacteria bacterium]|nr:Hpt domain-containing protein [Alphaproteobacteria bacterium]
MTINDDIIARLTREFLDDAVDRLSQVQLSLASIAAREGAYRTHLLDVSREVHNLKGTSGNFGFPTVSQIAHRFEDYLAVTAESETPPVAEWQRFADAMSRLIDGGKEPGEADRTAALSGLPVYFEFDLDSVHANPGNALVVTRARTMGHMLARELANCGFRTRTTSDPFEAMRIATTEAPDVMLTSAVLDVLTGVDLVRALRGMRASKGLPLAVVTSFDEGHAELDGIPGDVVVIRLGAHLEEDLGQVLTLASDRRAG